VVLRVVRKRVLKMSANNLGSKIKARKEPPNIVKDNVNDFDDEEDGHIIDESDMCFMTSMYLDIRCLHTADSMC
jgi:hypothetical protein